MGREKRNLPSAVTDGAKERHKRAQRSQYDPKAPMPEGFVAKPTIPKTKYHSYFEFVENKDKKKKLEFQVTSKKSPPPGFEFVPIGNPLLTTECKELSREKDAMIFIVSNAKEMESNHLAHQVHRIGHHIRETIVEEARVRIGQTLGAKGPATADEPEPIPESQEEYNAQVDAAIRDLFPRIPNTDRQMIVERAFRKGATISYKGEKPVGLSENITLARRVQLAVLAHIRHTHTRYDTLLKETTWQNARKVVEALCLDTLVKWRGDEETGRDQLDEILREVVVISDSEDDDSDYETDGSSLEEAERMPTASNLVESHVSGQVSDSRRRTPKTVHSHKGPLTPVKTKGNIKKNTGKRSSGKKAQRGFKRYHAWQEAIRRFREEKDEPIRSPIAQSPSQGPNQRFMPFDDTPLVPSNTQAPQVRLVTERAGPAPTENGYVAHHPPTQYGRAPVGSMPSSRSLPHQYMYEQVKSPVYTSSGQMSSQPVAFTANERLQDMLVPSIEPPSPDVMLPSFVRTVPPRVHGTAEYSSGHPHMAGPSRPGSPLRDTFMRDDFASGRRVVSDRAASGRQYNEDYPRSLAVNRDQNYVSSREGFPMHPAMHHPDERPYAYAGVSSIVSTHTSNLPAQRLSDRSNPVLMEDRGGFFERVSLPSENNRPLPRDAGNIDSRWPVQEIRRGPEPHRVVSWEEGSRILRENQGNARVEVIPISGSYAYPPDSRTHSRAIDPGVPNRMMHDVTYSRSEARDARYVYYQSPRQETRQIPGEILAPPYQPHQETVYREPAHRQFDEPPTVEPRRRGFPLHPHRPENVIVLE